MEILDWNATSEARTVQFSVWDLPDTDAHRRFRFAFRRPSSHVLFAFVFNVLAVYSLTSRAQSRWAVLGAQGARAARVRSARAGRHRARLVARRVAG
jgi:hypothetical protein